MFEHPEVFEGGVIEFDDVYQEISDYTDGQGGCASAVIMIAIGTASLIYPPSVILS